MTEATNTDETVKVYFSWSVYRPDQRQYRQQSVELLPQSVEIALDVPKQLTLENNNGNPFLTLQGLKYVVDQFDLAFAEKPESKSTDEEDWDEDTTEETTASSEDEWETDKSTPDETEWDESEEDWNEGE